jgi:hypothetical protein
MLRDITDNSLIRTKQTVFSITGYAQKNNFYSLAKAQRGKERKK